ncbi:MAG: cellulase family glycosylhydrolase [Sphaerospermopsis sp. SIO1G2]|nr:cellulase family glycosylhydrolase [Sphaerospermopsis sp. SIO1G2]
MATAAVENGPLQGWSLEQTDLSHRLQLHFYSADGSIVSFTARDVLVARVMRNETAVPILTEVTRADYNVIMMLEDGNWRVRHWVRASGSLLEPATLADPPTADFVSVAGNRLMWQERPYTVRGINYYPRETPWRDFWPAYDSAVIEEDFALIEVLGLNTVRIFVPFNPQLPEEDSEQGNIDPYEDLREKLADLLGHAEQHNLKVIVTLFDFRTDYQILLWPNSGFDAAEIVPYFADSPTILAWDIKNEPDLDQPGNTVEMVHLWLTHMVWQVRQHDPNHLVTIGWAKGDQAHQLADLVDFVSFHDYEPPETFGERVAGLRTAVPDKPLVLTEFGVPTWNSRFFPNGHTEREQAVYYADMRRVMAEETDVAGYMAWTLHDFARVPAAVVGRLPWRTGPQRHLGLVDGRGNKKEAAFLLAAEADLDVRRPFFLARFFKPFWQTVYMVLAVVWWLGRWVLRRTEQNDDDSN